MDASALDPDKEVQLTNGSRMPLCRAAALLTLIESYVEDSAKDRELIGKLRGLSPGQLAPPECRQRLSDAELVDVNGRISESLAQIVESAVRGAGAAVYLVSPFSNPDDKTLADLVSAVEVVCAEQGCAATKLAVQRIIDRSARSLLELNRS